MPVTLSSPLSAFSILAIWILAYIPAFMKTLALAKLGGFNNIQPRSDILRLEKKDVHPKILGRIIRMEGAHANGLENLPIWIAAVLLGNFAGVDNKTLNLASIYYIASRIVYNFLYISQSSQKLAAARTLTWTAGLASPFFLLFKAGTILYQQAA